MPGSPYHYPALPGNHNTSAPGADAVVTIGNNDRQRVEISGVFWSYTVDPVAPLVGRLTIMGGGFNVDFDITCNGAGFFTTPYPIKATDNTDVVITLHAIAGSVGKINVLCRGRNV